MSNEVCFCLPSGNWFSNFEVDTAGNSVTFDYFDRRRGQVARRYRVVFNEDTHGVVSIVAVSANGGRVEHFSSCRYLEFVRLMWWGEKIKAMKGVEEAEEAKEAKKVQHNPTAGQVGDLMVFIPVVVPVIVFILMTVLGIALR